GARRRLPRPAPRRPDHSRLSARPPAGTVPPRRRSFVRSWPIGSPTKARPRTGGGEPRPVYGREGILWGRAGNLTGAPDDSARRRRRGGGERPSWGGPPPATPTGAPRVVARSPDRATRSDRRSPGSPEVLGVLGDLRSAEVARSGDRATTASATTADQVTKALA